MNVNKTDKMKRRFDRLRLYKLIKIIVIVITIPSLIVGSYLFWDIVFEGARQRIYGSCDQYINDPLWFTSCRELVSKEYFEEIGLMKKSIVIGVTLPTIFFGGSFLYKHLFPKIEDDK